MNTTYKAALFACLTFTSMIQTLDMSPAFAKHEKEFMEFVFIEGHNQVKAALNAQAKDAATIAALLLASGRLYCLPKNDSVEEAASKKSYDSYAQAFGAFLPEPTPTNTLRTIAAGLVGYEAYKWCQKTFNTIASITVLTNFLEEWDINKEYTPESYHSFFDELAEIYDVYGEEVFYDYATDIVSGLQFIIKRTELKVSEVYKKEFENNASAFNIFDTPKFLGEIVKNSKEIIKL